MTVTYKNYLKKLSHISKFAQWNKSFIHNSCTKAKLARRWLARKGLFKAKHKEKRVHQPDLMIRGTKRFYSSEELSHILGVKRNTLAVWRGTGRGPTYIKIGGMVRYAASDVDQYLKGRKCQSTTRNNNFNS